MSFLKYYIHPILDTVSFLYVSVLLGGTLGDITKVPCESAACYLSYCMSRTVLFSRPSFSIFPFFFLFREFNVYFFDYIKTKKTKKQKKNCLSKNKKFQ